MSRAEASSSTSSETALDWGHAIRATLLAWALPGGGHFYLRKKRLAVAFGAIVLASLLIGVSLDGNLYRIVSDRPLTILATLASMGTGLPYFALRYLVGYSGDLVAPGFEYGSAFILTAGLMNLLLVLDCWDIVNGRKE
jgi:hypothetical protein